MDIIKEAVQTIINTRDFCGNEKEAIRDLCADYGVSDWQSIWASANYQANAEWNNWKKVAGVNIKYRY